MKKLAPFSLLICALALAACGGGGSNSSGNVSVDAKGDCTEQFRTDYNAVVHTLKDAAKKNASTAEEVKPVKESCDKFRAVHADGVTCQASDESRSQYDPTNRLTADSGKIYKACGMIDQLFARAATHGPTLEGADGPATGNVHDCTQSYYNAAAKVVTAARTASNAMTAQNIQKAQRACAPFKAAYAKSFSCNAVDAASGSKTVTKAADLYFVCEKIEEAGN